MSVANESQALNFYISGVTHSAGIFRGGHKKVPGQICVRATTEKYPRFCIVNFVLALFIWPLGMNRSPGGLILDRLEQLSTAVWYHESLAPLLSSYDSRLCGRRWLDFVQQNVRIHSRCPSQSNTRLHAVKIACEGRNQRTKKSNCLRENNTKFYLFCCKTWSLDFWQNLETEVCRFYLKACLSIYSQILNSSPKMQKKMFPQQKGRQK